MKTKKPSDLNTRSAATSADEFLAHGQIIRSILDPSQNEIAKVLEIRVLTPWNGESRFTQQVIIKIK